MQRLVERAIEGEPRALAVARLLPEMREQPCKFKLSPVTNIASATQALSQVMAAISSGLISPNEGSAMAGVVSAYIRALEATSIEKRLEALEETREQREQRENRPFLQEAAE